MRNESLPSRTEDHKFISKHGFACIQNPSFFCFRIFFVAALGGVDTYFEDGLHFQYQDNAHVVALFPLWGPSRGGTEMEVFGRFFVDSKSLVCQFVTLQHHDDPRPETGIINIRANWISPSKVTCVSPQLPRGWAYVEVSNNGMQFTQDHVSFQAYDEPSILGIHPPSGSVLGGYDIVLQGSTFFFHSSSALCRFGTSSFAPVAYISHTNVSCAAPPNQEGPMSVEYSLNGVDFTQSGRTFVYSAPSMALSVFPARGPATGGTRVRVQGHHFEQDTVCRFGDVEAVAVEFRSKEEIVCVSPPLTKKTTLFESSCTAPNCRTSYDHEVQAQAIFLVNF
jgi:hypothetical protein